MLKVCLAGATGWAGSELARGIAAVDDLELVSAVSRKHAGEKLEAVLGEKRLDTPVFASAPEALARPCGVFVEYTTAPSAKANVLAALEHGVHGLRGRRVVAATTGRSDRSVL